MQRQSFLVVAEQCLSHHWACLRGGLQISRLDWVNFSHQQRLASIPRNHLKF